MTAGARGCLLATLALLVAEDVGVAGERAHTVRAGESASQLAGAYYGDPHLAAILLEYNGKRDTTLQVGEVLRVPYAEIHLVRPGDTWSGLAQRHLGAASLHAALAAVNGRSPGEPLHVDDRVVLPVRLPHRLRRGETLAVLAERYLGDPERSAAMRLLNRIDDPRRLSVGEIIGVPLTDLKLRADAPTGAGTNEERADEAAPEPVPEAPPAPRPEQRPTSREDPDVTTMQSPPSFAAQIRAAAEAFDAADYGRARTALEALREPVLAAGDGAERQQWSRLLAFVYVAFDLPEEACDAYRLARGADLDPDRVSPKIRDTLSSCRPAGPAPPPGARGVDP